jgi:ribose transport system ATP-binding protein
MNDVQNTNISVLQIHNLTKTFPGMRALDNVDFEVRAGEIHALVGHNGSGKSTLIKILSGFHTPDEGTSISVAGEPFVFGQPQTSRELGLRFVHQDLGLIDTLSAAENIALDIGYQVKNNRILWTEERKRATQLLGVLESSVHPDDLIANLGPAARTEVAIARALASSGRPTQVMVLDEPTANIAASETARLFAILRKLKQTGVAIVFVSHMIDEILQLSDRVSVLREGCMVGTFDTQDISHERLVELIVGTKIEGSRRSRTATTSGTKPEVICVDELQGDGVEELSFAVAPGEILGIAGITGSGREDVAGLLFGAVSRKGSVEVSSQEVKGGDPNRSIMAGIVLLPSERMRRAIIPTMTLRENMTLPSLKSVTHYGRIVARLETKEAKDWLVRLKVRPQDPEVSPASLSGGNQQRVVLAKCLRLKPKVLVLDEPTQGVDVGAKKEIYALIAQVASEGAAVITCSSDSEELAAIADRVLIMQRGRVTHTLVGDEVTHQAIDTLELGGSLGDEKNNHHRDTEAQR